MNTFKYFQLAKQLNEQHRETLLEYPARFRGSFNSLSLISLKCSKPQLGLSGIQDKVQKKDFHIHDLLSKLDKLDVPKRPTPEKELQSWLLKNEMRNGHFAFDEDLQLVTDEFANRNESKAVADIFAFNKRTGAFVLVELKSQRQLKKLTGQLTAAEAAVKNDLPAFTELLRIHSFNWLEPFAIEKIAIWPKECVGKRFGSDILEFGYVKEDCNFKLYESL
jgi:hypothetical protein